MSQRGKYGTWSKKDLEHALAAFRRGDYGLNKCAREFGIPKATLKRHIENKNKRANDKVKITGRHTVFSEEIESELVKHILTFEEHMFGMTITDIRKLAYEIASRNNIKHNFNSEKRMAGKKWYYSFMARHKELSLRQPESTSMGRAKAFTRSRVDEFFSILENLCDTNKFSATQIYNVDETGCSTVQRKCQKVVALKGKHQVGSLASGERGVNTTVVCCASAAGQFVPPMIIFKRKRYQEELATGAPPGSIVTISDSGYINAELFVTWLNHFIKVVKPSLENPVLVLLDGHSTHSKNLQALEIARANGIKLLQLPSHTTHRLQPLDVGFFRSFQNFFAQAIQKWLRSNPGRTVSMFQISALVGEAYGLSATVRNATNAFRACGVWPIDRHVFRDTDFAASNILNGLSETVSNQEESSSDEEVPLLQLMKRKHSTDLLNVSIQAISPLPVKTTKEAPKSRTQNAVELTSSPYKSELEAAKASRANLVKIRLQAEPSTSKVNIVKKQIKPSKSKTKNIMLSKNNLPEVTEIEDESWYCAIRQEAEPEEMIQCMGCGTWCHVKCANASRSMKRYFCIDCNSRD